MAIFGEHILTAQSLFYPTGKGARRAPRLLKDHRKFLLALQALKPNMSFVSKQVKSCLSEHARVKKNVH